MLRRASATGPRNVAYGSVEVVVVERVPDVVVVYDE